VGAFVIGPLIVFTLVAFAWVALLRLAWRVVKAARNALFGARR
jgi:hypothetical protein